MHTKAMGGIDIVGFHVLLDTLLVISETICPVSQMTGAKMV